MHPGAIALARIPCGASSTARDLVKLMIAHLAAVFGDCLNPDANFRLYVNRRYRRPFSQEFSNNRRAYPLSCPRDQGNASLKLQSPLPFPSRVGFTVSLAQWP